MPQKSAKVEVAFCLRIRVRSGAAEYPNECEISHKQEMPKRQVAYCICVGRWDKYYTFGSTVQRKDLQKNRLTNYFADRHSH